MLDAAMRKEERRLGPLFKKIERETSQRRIGSLIAEWCRESLKSARHLCMEAIWKLWPKVDLIDIEATVRQIKAIGQDYLDMALEWTDDYVDKRTAQHDQTKRWIRIDARRVVAWWIEDFRDYERTQRLGPRKSRGNRKKTPKKTRRGAKRTEQTPQETKVMILHGQRWTDSQIAKELGISRQRAWQLRRSAEKLQAPSSRSVNLRNAASLHADTSTDKQPAQRARRQRKGV